MRSNQMFIFFIFNAWTGEPEHFAFFSDFSDFSEEFSNNSSDINHGFGFKNPS